MMYLVLGERNDSLPPTEPVERKKFTMSILENVKKDMDRGDPIMWGISLGGGRAFIVTKQNEKDIYAKLSMARPYWKFEVIPMLTIEEMVDVRKGMKK